MKSINLIQPPKKKLILCDPSTNIYYHCRNKIMGQNVEPRQPWRGDKFPPRCLELQRSDPWVQDTNAPIDKAWGT